MSMTDKIRERRLRRAAKRHGLRLVKSRTRDRLQLDHGRYNLINDCAANRSSDAVARESWRCEMTLDDVAQELAVPAATDGKT